MMRDYIEVIFKAKVLECRRMRVFVSSVRSPNSIGGQLQGKGSLCYLAPDKTTSSPLPSLPLLN